MCNEPCLANRDPTDYDTLGWAVLRHAFANQNRRRSGWMMLQIRLGRETFAFVQLQFQTQAVHTSCKAQHSWKDMLRRTVQVSIIHVESRTSPCSLQLIINLADLWMYSNTELCASHWISLVDAFL